MTSPELGFLLLASHLGDPNRKCLTVPQLSQLFAAMARAPEPPAEGEVDAPFLESLGLPRELAQRIPALLAQEALAIAYLRQGERLGLRCITRRSPDYPKRLVQAMGSRAPAVLWISGDAPDWSAPRISLVGSRSLQEENRRFAAAAGAACARQGYTLVSGSAIGADSAAQESCLKAGGSVLSVLPAPIRDYAPPAPNQRYLWEDSYDLPFSAYRALSRNHIIHALGEKVLVAQSSLRTGGTWNGTIQNLLHGYSPVFLLDDGSQASQALAQRGAALIRTQDLENLAHLAPMQSSFLG